MYFQSSFYYLSRDIIPPFLLFFGLLLRPGSLTFCAFLLQGKRTNLRKTGSERIAHGMRVKFNPLALLLDSSLEGEFDLVQRIIYEVRLN